MFNNTIKSERGSTVSFVFTWPGGLVGSSVEVFEAHSLLRETITLTIEDEEKGLVHGEIAWDDRYPRNDDLDFRIRVVDADGSGTSMPLIRVIYE